MDFKVSYLDAGLNNSYFSDHDSTPITSTPAPTPKARRYKTQLRDFLASCRSKRKIAAGAGDYSAQDPAAPVAATASSIQQMQQAAVAAAATTYTTPYNCNVYGGTTYAAPENNLYVHQQQNFYHHPANFENRYLDSTSLFQYRTLGTYYPEYTPAAYVGNGFLDVSRGCIYDNQYAKDSACQLEYKGSHNSDANISRRSLDVSKGHKGSSLEVNGLKGEAEGSLKREDYMMHYTNGNDTRQTVLMWGSSTGPGHLGRHNSVIQPQSMYATEKKYVGCGTSDPLRSLTEMNSTGSTPASTPSSIVSSNECKWGVGSIIKSSLGDPGPTSTSHHHVDSSHHNGGGSVLENSSAMAAAAAAKYLHSYHPSPVGVGVGMGMSMGVGVGSEQGSGSEVWVYPPPPTHQ